MPWQKTGNVKLFSVLSCKPGFTIFYIVDTDVFKDFVIDFCLCGFSIITSDFPLETLETLQTFLGYSFIVSFTSRSTD